MEIDLAFSPQDRFRQHRSDSTTELYASRGASDGDLVTLCDSQRASGLGPGATLRRLATLCDSQKALGLGLGATLWRFATCRVLWGWGRVRLCDFL